MRPRRWFVRLGQTARQRAQPARNHFGFQAQTNFKSELPIMSGQMAAIEPENVFRPASQWILAHWYPDPDSSRPDRCDVRHRPPPWVLAWRRIVQFPECAIALLGSVYASPNAIHGKVDHGRSNLLEISLPIKSTSYTHPPPQNLGNCAQNVPE
jgi:hypothetical protein